MFACPGNKVRMEVSSMPGVYQQSPDQIVEECREVADLGVPGVILFGLAENKDATGSEAAAANGAVQRSIEAIRKAKLNLIVITDVCLCEYTSHGHCGVIEGDEVLNDPTLESAGRSGAFARARRSGHRRAIGHDGWARGRHPPKARRKQFSGRRDLRLRREILLRVLRAVSRSRAIRAAIRRPPQLPDGSGERARSAARSRADIEEGADMIMVKPALAYLDIIQRVRERFDVPVGAYNVSAEFAMVKAAARNGWIDEKRIVLEIITGIQRAGASIILTYLAKDLGRWLKHC